jgi:hypothetical protein
MQIQFISALQSTGTGAFPEATDNEEHSIGSPRQQALMRSASRLTRAGTTDRMLFVSGNWRSWWQTAGGFRRVADSASATSAAGRVHGSLPIFGDIARDPTCRLRRIAPFHVFDGNRAPR